MDTNCFIDAVNKSSAAHDAISQIFRKAKEGALEIAVSEHTLAELRIKPDGALVLAESCARVPKWVAGSSTYAQVDKEVEQDFVELTEIGIDIRGKAAFRDALYSGGYAFITSDRALAGDRARKEINSRFQIKIIRPQQLSL